MYVCFVMEMANFKVDFVTWEDDDRKDSFFLHLTKDQYMDIIGHYKAICVGNATKDSAQRKA